MERRSGRPETYLFFGAAFLGLLILFHWTLLDLPYWWDEAGQFIPQARDLWEKGLWIPESTQPNVHPPGVIAYLATAWTLLGDSIETTRCAMLLVAAVGMLGAFLLAIELCRGIPGAPAFTSVFLLLTSPLFFMQSFLAQLDMPAMTWTVWTLFLFLRGRLRLAVLAATLLVLSKETGVLLPVWLGGWLLYDRRFREAAWFALPVAALAGWLIYLRAQTGNWLGHPEFSTYNVDFALHPVRIALALLRRIAFLGFENFHWLMWLSIGLAWKRGFLRSKAWALVGGFALAHVLLVSVVGGAALDRYLLPVLPPLYIAAAAGITALAGWRQPAARLALFTGLVVSLFWNPPFWPFPYENNLAMVDAVRLHQAAAHFVESRLPGRTVTTAWPLSIALSRPTLGYVEHPTKVREIPDFQRLRVLGLPRAEVRIFVLYSREWNPVANWLQLPAVADVARRYYGREEPLTGEELESRFGLLRVARYERGGQWIEVWAR